MTQSADPAWSSSPWSGDLLGHDARDRADDGRVLDLLVELRDARLDRGHPGPRRVDLLRTAAGLHPRERLPHALEAVGDHVAADAGVVPRLGGAGAPVEQALHPVQVLLRPVQVRRDAGHLGLQLRDVLRRGRRRRGGAARPRPDPDRPSPAAARARRRWCRSGPASGPRRRRLLPGARTPRGARRPSSRRARRWLRRAPRPRSWRRRHEGHSRRRRGRRPRGWWRGEIASCQLLFVDARGSGRSVLPRTSYMCSKKPSTVEAPFSGTTGSSRSRKGRLTQKSIMGAIIER